MLREIAKNPRVTSQTLQASVSMLNVEIHDSTIGKRLNKYGLFGRVARGMCLLSKKNKAAWLMFAKMHLDKPQDFWNNVLWTDKTGVEMFGHNAHCHVWRTVKHSMSPQTRWDGIIF